MARPIIRHIQPFDAEKDYEISISWTGNRSYANRIIIYDNETNGLAFDDTVSTFALKHIIPAYTLQNGKSWTIEAQIFDEENISSPLSEKILFYTFQTPTFEFNNIPENGKITTASFIASVSFYSPDWEDISTYKFYLYDSTKKPLLESNSLSDRFNIGYAYRGLENNTFYYIRCVGVTVHGMELDTGYVKIDVNYKNPNAYARLYTDAIPSRGCVQVSSNLIVIQYNGLETFEYENGMINLIDKTLHYKDGFIIEDDFTVIIRGKHMWQTNDIFKMKNDNFELAVSSRIYTNEKLRFRLIVPNGMSNYMIYSNELLFTDDDLVALIIRRKNNVYQLKVFINGEEA